MKLNKQIEVLRDILKKKFGAKQIIIFGSFVYGKPGKDSDIDVCLITDIKNKRKIDILREIRRELLDIITFPLDLLVYNEKEFNERSVLKNTLEYKIITDGMKVYG